MSSTNDAKTNSSPLHIHSTIGLKNVEYERNIGHFQEYIQQIQDKHMNSIIQLEKLKLKCPPLFAKCLLSKFMEAEDCLTMETPVPSNK